VDVKPVPVTATVPVVAPTATQNNTLPSPRTARKMARTGTFEVWIKVVGSGGQGRYYRFLGKGVAGEEADRVDISVPALEHTYSVHISALGPWTSAWRENLERENVPVLAVKWTKSNEALVKAEGTDAEGSTLGPTLFRSLQISGGEPGHFLGRCLEHSKIGGLGAGLAASDAARDAHAATLAQTEPQEGDEPADFLQLFADEIAAGSSEQGAIKIIMDAFELQSRRY